MTATRPDADECVRSMVRPSIPPGAQDRFQPLVPLPADVVLDGSFASGRCCVYTAGEASAVRLSSRRTGLCRWIIRCPAGHRAAVTCSGALGSASSPCNHYKTDVMAALRPEKLHKTAVDGTAAGAANSIRRVAGDPACRRCQTYPWIQPLPFQSAKAVQKIVPVRLRCSLSRTGRLGIRHPPCRMMSAQKKQPHAKALAFTIP